MTTGVQLTVAANSATTIRLSGISNWYAVAAVALLLSSLIYFGHAEATGSYQTFNNPLKPSYFYFLTYALTGLYLAANREAFNRWRDYWPFFAAMTMMLALHLWWMPFAGQNSEQARIFVLRVNTLLMGICLTIIIAQADNLKAIVRAVQVVMWGTALLNVAVVLMPGLFPVKMGVYAGRAAGLYWDPNQCATFLAMALPLMCLGASHGMRLVHYGIVLVGIAFTFSREGIVLWLVAVTLDHVMLSNAAQGMATRLLRLMRVLLIVGLVAGLFLIFYQDIINALRPFLNTDTFSRLSGVDRGTTNERIRLMLYGWEAFAQQPILGMGYGSTHVWSHGLSVHNMFVLMLAEFGLVGFAAYCFMLGALLYQGTRIAVVIFAMLVIQSVFTHSYFDLPYYLLLAILYLRMSMEERDRTLGRPHAGGLTW
ncbi:MAG: hypothetical protein KIT02_08510 [Devosia sp.]|uniref:O-antigen ligase family protein n=1 Tax=Devosia sp. TaxID=1871048 RepID=UPI0024CA3D48|nr:O-antigen ligase family protein [Devosia sp.]UYO01226.1 MAG: hypothetical protein KIT02_08510 [Devosia sp.]